MSYRSLSGHTFVRNRDRVRRLAGRTAVADRPNAHGFMFVLGVAYHDAKDGHANEDAFIFEGDTLTHTTPSELLARFPQYDQFHWSEKPYLQNGSDA